ncbi:MAG: hypothetical protein WC222_08930 [Parachlamydiales bacterium]|jgi:hypothetical protein
MYKLILTSLMLLSSTLSSLPPPENPLATVQNAALDDLSIRIYNQEKFQSKRNKARNLYKLFNGELLTDREKELLDQTVDELVFSTIQKAANNDPYFPKVYWVDSTPRKWFNLDVPGGRYSYDNPDCIYRTIPISGSYSYEIQGHRYNPGPTDIVFSLIKDVNTQRTVTYLKGSDIVLDEKGDYTLTVDPYPANGRVNHIQSTSDAVQLFIRNNLGDWNTETPDYLTVSRVDYSPRPPKRTDQDIIDETYDLLDGAIFAYVFGAFEVKTDWNCENTLPQPSQSETLGTLVTQAASFGHFEIDADQVLVADVNLGAATYFVFPITGPWTITLDPATHQCSLNNKQAVPNTDGTYTFVISHEDPGVYNWLDTAGLLNGTMQVRWQNVSIKTDPVKPSVNMRVVDRKDLAKALPAGTLYVTPEERKVILAERKAAHIKRTQE